MTSYEIHYFQMLGRADLARMMLDVSGAPYKNVFVDFAAWRGEQKERMPFGKVPKLSIFGADGATKVGSVSSRRTLVTAGQELCESTAIDAYLAEILGLMPGPEPFARAECLSALSSLSELENAVRPSYFLPTLEARKAAFEKARAETIPQYLTYQERFVRGAFYFGEQVCIGLLRLLVLAAEQNAAHCRRPQNIHDLPAFQCLLRTREQSVLDAQGGLPENEPYHRDS